MKTKYEPDKHSPACGFLLVDKDRKVLSCNLYAMTMLSCESTEEIVGLNIEEIVSFATRIFLDSYTYPMLLNDGLAEEVQLSFKSMAGGIVPVVANIHMDSDNTTSWTLMACANRDQLYNELLTARDSLQCQAQSLSLMNEQIEKRQADLQAFCRSLSHDFTGPLRRINQLIECALEDLQTNGIEAVEEYRMLNNAQKNADTLLAMTNGLVEYFVADIPVSLDEVVHIEDIVSSVLAMREQQDAMMPKINMTSQPICAGSNAQCQVLFKNLIENAIKYNENDPVVTISHSEDAANDQIVIAIKDNGIGMSSDYIDTIFTPFTRLHSAAEYKGSGLGLSIVKKMVMNHDGDIRVESTLGKGSTFYVSLPKTATQRG